jgi:hypothetical protein
MKPYVYDTRLLFSCTLFARIKKLWLVFIEKHILQGIEQLKKEEARWVRNSRWKSIQAVFGRFSIAWFSPFTSPPNAKTKLDSYLYSV